MKDTHNIFLIGFMGCGKSTVADEFQQKHGMRVCEMDQMIVDREQMEISQIFHLHGESYFRDLETKILKEICQKDNQVISCGGGVVLREENVSAMKSAGSVVWLTAKPETILERVYEDTNRPILQGKKNISAISELMENRREKYESAADIVIETDGKDIPSICEEIINRLTKMGE